AGGLRPRRNAELSFLPKSQVGESAWQNRNGKFLAKWLPGCDRSLRARFASHLRNKFAMRLEGLFRFTQGSKGFRRKETTCSGAGQRSTRMANSSRRLKVFSDNGHSDPQPHNLRPRVHAGIADYR